MICPNCKENIPDGSKFCANCGSKLTVNEAVFTIPQADGSTPVQSEPPVNETAPMQNDAVVSESVQSVPKTTEETSAPITNEATQTLETEESVTANEEAQTLETTENTLADETPQAEQTSENNGFTQMPVQNNAQANGFTPSPVQNNAQANGFTPSPVPNGAPANGFNQSQTANIPPQPSHFQNPLMQKKAIDRRVIFAGIAAIAVIFLALILVLTHKKKIDLHDYIAVEFDGYDSFGTASVDFDYDKFYKDLKDSISERKAKKAAEEMKDTLAELDLSSLSEGVASFSEHLGYLAVCDGLNWELDKDAELSNGDTVTLSFDFDNDLAKKYGIKFVGKDKEFTVKGLEEVTVIDPFKDIEVTFSGTAPNASASVTNNSDEDVVKSLYFNIEPNYNLSKGDKITVSIDIDEEYILSEYGCKFSATSKEYTCDNVDAYLTDGADISDELLTSMKNQTLDTIDSYFASNSDYLKASDKKYVGYYFLTNKQEDSWYERNIVYIVYSVKVKSIEKEFKDTTVYMPVKFTDVLQYAEGTQYVSLDYTSIQGDSSLEYSWWSRVSGYDKKNIMENELITAEKGEFNTAAFGDLE